MRWLTLALMAIWIGFAANAWKYFSDFGLYGVYLAARYSFEVIDLPEAEMPDNLAGHRPMSEPELYRLIHDKPLLSFEHETMREQRFGLEITGPNSVISGSSLSFGAATFSGHFLLKDNEICLLEPIFMPTNCRFFFLDEDGGLYNALPGDNGTEWQKISVR
ncbi:hypothetical protein [Aurantiacibacter gangjinensis]|uniref:Uncharacterized protein n=1 Tax=Aurantiacibacter gangjinensis TaxID=502682 RepID=A0A0G9MQP4_9SPHN|nr:hypothetical protein [Aurantiacibacter gangjinensis]KLE33035.1 hypothetical protein AAW01_03290 [Aurantiacibacter gangjinensis]